MIEPGINREALWEALDYKPHAAQMLYHDSKARHRIACCGRRFGKSVMAGHNMTQAMFVPDTHYFIVGPTYSLGEKEFRIVFDDFFRKLKLGTLKGMRKSYNLEQGNMSIRTPWNSVLEVKSADKADSLVGEGLDGVIMSEAAIHKKDTWEMYIEPALLDKRGWADFVSTPRGHNFFEGLWLMGQDPRFENFESWRFPTWTNSAMFPLGIDDPNIQDIKRKSTEFHWLQEYCAEFAAIEGRIYPMFDRKIHVGEYKYNPRWKNFQVFDFGFNDPFVCLDIQVDPSDNVYVWREYQVKQKTTTEHGVALMSRNNPPHFKVDGRFADPRDPDAIRTLNFVLSGAHTIGRTLPVERGISEKLQGYDKVGQWMKVQPDGRPKFFIDRSCTDTIRQVEQLQAPKERDGHNAKEGQREYDDHGCFVAGTLVTTLHGQVPIEEIKIGDYALTRQGFKRVADASFTGIREVYEVCFSDGSKIEATRDHPIWVEDKGFTAISDLVQGEKCLKLQKKSLKKFWLIMSRNQSQLGTMELSSIDTLTHHSQRDETTGVLGREIDNAESNDFIKKSGKLQTGLRSLKDTKFITKILIPLTTIRITWSVSLLQSIKKYTPRLIWNSSVLLDTKLIYAESGLAGIAQKKVKLGTVSTQRKFGRKSSQSSKLATTVQKSFFLKWGESLTDSAQELVRLPGELRLVSIMKRDTVKFVKHLLKRISTGRFVTVVSISGARKPQPVYNLTITDIHEFYANGVLVSNCDAIRYFFAEYFILGFSRGDLGAVYSSRPTEADTFFTYQSSLRRD